MSIFTCPCGGTNWGEGAPLSDVTCPKCGRQYHHWTGGHASWLEDPAVKAVNQLEAMGRSHFQQIHREVARVERMVRHLAKQLKIKFPKGRPRS